MPSKEILLENFYYDPTSPTFLRRNKTMRCGRSNNILMYSIGDVVGHINQGGYYTVLLNKVHLSVHRVIWILLNDYIDHTVIVDHIDRVKTNNDISNLRIVDAKTNSQNKKKHVTNTSGKTGLQLFKDYRSDPPKLCWRAIWMDNKVPKCKSFSVSKYGYDEARRLASEHRDRAIKELNDKGNNYTDTHGH